MDANRFDTISKLFASRKTRRGAIAGLAGAAVGGRALAQDGTPEVATPAVDPTDPHPSADDAQAEPEFLFVQPFDSGTWASKDGEDGVYTLTLTGAAANTVYFSDRPDRIVGLSATQRFLDGLGFTPDNPPNAALVARTDDGDKDVLVIEMLNPEYDADAGTLTYDARVLADYGEPGLAHLAQQQQDYELAESFGEGGLFIDNCQMQTVICRVMPERRVVGTTLTKFCFDQSTNACRPCVEGKLVCGAAFKEECRRHIGQGRYENVCVYG